MIRTIKVMLLPNNKQRTKLFKYANASRFAYNWARAEWESRYNQGIKVNEQELRKEFNRIKGTEYPWVLEVSNNVTKQAIKDLGKAYVNFFKGTGKYPKFKSRKHSKPSFYQDTDKIKFSISHVKLEGLANSRKKNRQTLNWVKLAEFDRIPTDVKYYNPRITYDGINWWISVGIEENGIATFKDNEGIGIDFGIKNFAKCSDGITHKNINKSSKVIKLENKRRRLQRQISRKYYMNNEGGRYKKTSNIIKSEKKLLKLNHRLSNIRHIYRLQVINDIINRKPRFITVEDLNVSGMMKNKHLSKAIQNLGLYETLRILQYKCKWEEIELRQVDRFYPSSKMCNICGNIKKDLKLSDRVYVCECCGNIEDRDYNASLNLRNAKEYKIVSL